MQNPSLARWQTLTLVVIFFGVLLWSAIEPKDGVTWFLEVFPALLGGVVLAATFQRFPLTPLAYVLVLGHSIVLMVGGHYTYAEVPLFDQIAEIFGQSRNNYDKLGHFVQGFVPVILARELLSRLGVVNGAKWNHFLSVCFCLAFSAFYELIEWGVALLSDEAADAFLGTQGYVWDTQSDMGWALLGAISGLVLLSAYHTKQIARLESALRDMKR